eukprot:15366494-Ditylum_brightwellii.AAC.1
MDIMPDITGRKEPKTQSSAKDNDETLQESEQIRPFRSSLRNSSIIENKYNQAIIKSVTESINMSKTNSNIQGMSMNKLRFHLVGLLGRDEEIKMLRTCLERVMQSEQQKKEVVIISGHSGTGKTALAFNLKKQVNAMRERRGAFVAGKCDQFHSGEPLSAISQAFGELCCKVAKEGETICNEIEAKLCAELQNEVRLLTQIIPEMDRIMNSKVQPPTKTSDDVTSHARQAKLSYAFRVLTRVVSSYFSPLVICLDDLQWADISSLEIIELLASDDQNRNSLMIIACYRSNEVDATHMLSSTLHNLVELRENNNSLLSLTQMEVGNLDKEEVNQAITSLLSFDEVSQTEGLASICYKRTLGNPFFLREFVKLLEEEGLLYFHLGLFRWMWDEADIESKTVSTKNVVDLLQGKMRRLPQEAQGFLRFISCFGASFTRETVRMIWEKQRTIIIETSTANTGTEELLASMVEENYLEALEDNKYRWAHDNVEQAASSLTNEDSRSSFRSSIGEMWYQELGKDNLDPCLFEVANLLDTETIDMTNIECAKLYLMAAEKARDTSVFDSCSIYASKGIDMLPGDKWASEPRLAVKLYSLAAEAEGFLGHHSRMESYCYEVLGQKSVSTLEKKDIYLVKLHRMANAELRYADAIELCLTILKDLGCRFPRGGRMGLMIALVSVHRTVKMVKKTPIEALDSLPVVTDPLILATSAFLNRLTEWTYLAGGKFSYLYILATTKMVQMTLSYGSFALSATSFASLGSTSFSVMGDVDTLQYLGERSLRLQERCESEAGR